MMTKSAQCRTTAESTAAASIIHGIGPQKWDEQFQQRIALLLGQFVIAELLAPLHGLGVSQTCGGRL